MNQSDLEAVERFCPETRVIKKYYEHPDNRKRAAITVNEQEWDAIAACIVKLGEDVKLWKDRTIHAYSDGYKAAEENIRKERGNDFDASVRKYKAGRR